MDFFVATGDSAVDLSGRLAGGGICVFLLMLGCIKCWQIMRRPATHTLCVMALMLVLMGFLLSAMGNMLVLVFGFPRGLVAGLVAPGSGILMMVAFVLGIIGLTNYDRSRFAQGRAQALWAVVLGGIVVVSIPVGMIVGIVRAVHEREVGGGGAQATGSGALVDVERRDYGYRTKLAGQGWTTWTSASGNALIDFRAKRSNEMLVVLPLRFDGEPPDLDALSRGLVSALNLKHVQEEDFETSSWDPGHGGTGRELEIEQDLEGDLHHYLVRVARGSNSAHLIAGWTVTKAGDINLVRRGLDAITLSEPEGSAPVLKSDQKRSLGLVLNEAGISLMIRNDNESAAAWFEKGFRLGNDPTVLGNAGDALEKSGQAVKGRDLLAPHMDKFSKHPYLGYHFARLQVMSGNVEAGSATFLRLIEHGLKNEDDLLAWLTMLAKLEQYPPALRCADAWVARSPTLNARRWQAQTYDTSGDIAKAVGLFEKLHADYPKDSKVALDLGSCYNDAGDHAKAAAIAEKLLADGKESSRAHMVLGWSQMGRKWYRDAKASFELAARKQADDATIQDAIRRASAALGQGDNSEIKTPIAPVAMPPEVASALAAETVLPGAESGYSAVWLLRATGYHFETGKPVRRTIHRRVKVLTADGAKDFSSVEVKFEPLGERIFMNRLEVKDADGIIVAKGALDDAYVRDLNSSAASHDKTLHMQVAGVQPGTTVEWEVTIENRSTSETFEFQRHLFATGVPTAGEAVFVTGEVPAVRSELAHAEGLKKIRTAEFAAWIAPARPAVVTEPFSVSAEQRCPMLWLGGDEGSWEKVGRDYLKEIEGRLVVDQVVTELAATLVAGKTRERDKIAAIARHVQKEINYKAIEFGVRARRPNPAADTLRLRYGDCKDTALLTHLLLRAAGIKSYLALVNTGWKVQPALPTLDQFNHMVVHVPSLGENWLLDATDKALALARFPADYLWHAQALVLDPEGPRLISSPAPAAPECAAVKSERLVSIEGTDWRVEETLTLTGYYAGWMRSAFTGLSAAGQREKVQGILAEHGAAQVHEFRLENPDDIDEPARIFLRYDVRDGVTTTNNRHSGMLPALWERDYLGIKFVKDRKTDFECLYPMHFTSEVTVKLPAPVAADALAALTRQANSEFCSWSLKPEVCAGGVVLHFEFMARSGVYAADRYAVFHESWDAVRRAWDKPLGWGGK